MTERPKGPLALFHSDELYSVIPLTSTATTLRRAGVPSTTTPLPLMDPCPFAARRFSLRDRVTVHDWMLRVAGIYGRMLVERADGLGHAEPGDYLLIYRRDSAWASWGIGCGIDGYLLWETIRGATVGIFPTLHTALAEIIAQS